jgi:hypothetical protein
VDKVQWRVRFTFVVLIHDQNAQSVGTSKVNGTLQVNDAMDSLTGSAHACDLMRMITFCSASMVPFRGSVFSWDLNHDYLFPAERRRLQVCTTRIEAPVYVVQSHPIYKPPC